MLTLQKPALHAMFGWATRYPEVEVCGLLWQSGAGTQHVRLLRNTHPEPQRYYRTDPGEVRQTFDYMDKHDGHPVAWFHSHPGGKPDPSEADMQGAMDTQVHYLILYPEVVASEPALPAKSLWRLSAWECIELGVLVQAEWLEAA